MSQVAGRWSPEARSGSASTALTSGMVFGGGITMAAEGRWEINYLSYWNDVECSVVLRLTKHCAKLCEFAGVQQISSEVVLD